MLDLLGGVHASDAPEARPAPPPEQGSLTLPAAPPASPGRSPTSQVRFLLGVQFLPRLVVLNLKDPRELLRIYSTQEHGFESQDRELWETG